MNTLDEKAWYHKYQYDLNNLDIDKIKSLFEN